MIDKEKPLEWIGSSHKDLMALPMDVRRFFGYAYHLLKRAINMMRRKSLRDFMVPA